MDADRERPSRIASPDRVGHALEPLLAGGAVRWNGAVRILVAKVPRPYARVARGAGRRCRREPLLGSDDLGVRIPVVEPPTLAGLSAGDHTER